VSVLFSLTQSFSLSRTPLPPISSFLKKKKKKKELRRRNGEMGGGKERLKDCVRLNKIG